MKTPYLSFHAGILATGPGNESLDLDTLAEVDQEADQGTCRCEIVQALRGVNVIQGPCRFELDQNHFIHDKVRNVFPDHNTIVVNRNRTLLLNCQSFFRNSCARAFS